MSNGNCTADSCTKCIDQTNEGNFQSCYWDESGGYCYNWFDDPNSSGTSTKFGCPSVYIPVIIAVIVAVFICIALCVWQRKKLLGRRNDALIYNNGGVIDNNVRPVYNQPNVIVANPNPNIINPQNNQYNQVYAQPVPVIPQQQYQSVQPVQAMPPQYVQPSMQPVQAPPAYAPHYQQEGGYTNQ